MKPTRETDARNKALNFAHKFYILHLHIILTNKAITIFCCVLFNATFDRQKEIFKNQLKINIVKGISYGASKEYIIHLMDSG
jgi:hypothetical protein